MTNDTAGEHPRALPTCLRTHKGMSMGIERPHVRIRTGKKPQVCLDSDIYYDGTSPPLPGQEKSLRVQVLQEFREARGRARTG